MRQARVLMSGQLTERTLLRPSGRTGVVSVRFKAAGAARFFNLPYEEIVDQVIDFSKHEKEAASTLAKKIEEYFGESCGRWPSLALVRGSSAAMNSSTA